MKKKKIIVLGLLLVFMAGCRSRETESEQAENRLSQVKEELGLSFGGEIAEIKGYEDKVIVQITERPQNWEAGAAVSMEIETPDMAAALDAWFAEGLNSEEEELIPFLEEWIAENPKARCIFQVKSSLEEVDGSIGIQENMDLNNALNGGMTDYLDELIVYLLRGEKTE